MKSVLLGFVFMLVFLPQVSFGAVTNPVELACTQKLDPLSVAFFQQQAQERADFIKANPGLIAKQDQQGKWKMAHKNGQGNRGSSTINPSFQLTSQEESTFAAFMQKQQSDKVTFLQQQAEAMKKCVGSQ